MNQQNKSFPERYGHDICFFYSFHFFLDTLGQCFLWWKNYFTFSVIRLHVVSQFFRIWSYSSDGIKIRRKKSDERWKLYAYISFRLRQTSLRLHTLLSLSPLLLRSSTLLRYFPINQVSDSKEICHWTIAIDIVGVGRELSNIQREQINTKHLFSIAKKYSSLQSCKWQMLVVDTLVICIKWYCGSIWM